VGSSLPESEELPIYYSERCNMCGSGAITRPFSGDD